MCPAPGMTLVIANISFEGSLRRCGGDGRRARDDHVEGNLWLAWNEVGRCDLRALELPQAPDARHELQAVADLLGWARPAPLPTRGGPASLARKARPEAAGLQIRRQLSRILPGLMATSRMGHGPAGELPRRIDHIAAPGLAWRDRQRFIFNPQLIEPLRSRNLNTGTRISR